MLLILSSNIVCWNAEGDKSGNNPNSPWGICSYIPTGRTKAASGVVGNKFYVIGGDYQRFIAGSHYASYFDTSDHLECYDPTADSWSSKTKMPTARRGLAAAVIGTEIYAIGGYGVTNVSSKLECYYTTTDNWTTKAQMPTPRYELAAAVVDNKIYAIGGTNGSTHYAVVECYDPATDSWSTKSPMPTARRGLAVAVVDNKIYAIGGYNPMFLSNEGYLSLVECYDPATDSWSTKSPMPTARSNFAVAVVDNKIYAIGGYRCSYNNEYGKPTEVNHIYYPIVECYDPVNDTWMTGTSMSVGRCDLVAGAINYTIYTCGGSNGTTYVFSIVEYYNPTIDPYLIDSDRDGVVDAKDAFPNNPLEWNDRDGDGVGDNSDYLPGIHNTVALFAIISVIVFIIIILRIIYLRNRRKHALEITAAITIANSLYEESLQLLEEGNKAFEQEDYPDAIGFYKKAESKLKEAKERLQKKDCGFPLLEDCKRTLLAVRNNRDICREAMKSAPKV
ncbi:MAG: kelch repeat-containing protein [Thermoplasmata archaeon]